MYSKQQGTLPKVCFFIGTLIMGFCFFGVMADIYFLILDYGASNPEDRIYRLVTFPFGAFFGFIIASLFPDIRTTKLGIDFVYLGLLRNQITWNEVRQIKQLERALLFNGFFGLFIKRKGYHLFSPKGLFLATLHARFIGQYDPILFLSPELKELHIIKDQIKETSG